MKIKIIILMIFASLSMAMFAGCGNITASASGGLETATKLALGTLRLEGTSNAVTEAQAKELLTLWEGYQSISNSDTTSQVELEALVKQIEQAMTSEQLKAIDGMDLTEQAVTETLSTLGGSSASSTPSGVLNALSLVPSSAANESGSMPSSESSGSASSSLGGMPAGGTEGMPPDLPGGMPSGEDRSGISELLNGTSTQGTAVATQAPASTGSTQVNPMLLRAMIQLLETRSQAAG